MSRITINTSAYDTTDITSSTNVRDVSQILDLWAHKETPLLNRISWGAESGGLIIEWVTENLGWRYVETSAAIASDGTAFVVASGAGSGLTAAEQAKQLRPGTLFYAVAASSATVCGEHAWGVISTIATNTVTFAFLQTGAIAASAKIYIVGGFANEGSGPGKDVSRKRYLMSNKMSILREDINITGSQMATDMHAIGNEMAHQKALRLLELQRNREFSLLFGCSDTRAASTVGLMKGMAHWLAADYVAKDYVDNTTTTISKSAVNNLVAEQVELGFRSNVIVGSYTQIRKFSGWDEARIRSRPDDRVGGEWITSFLTDTGVELDLVAISQMPINWLFIFDTNNLVLRAKKGRKLLLEKLAKAGDYERWQLISEYSAEYRKIDQGAFAAFHLLT